MLLSSHLLEEVGRVADAVVILDHGKAVASGNVAELQAGDGPVQVMVTLDAPNTKLVTALRAARVKFVEVGSGRMLLTITTATDYDKLRDALAASGAGVRSIQRQRETLEDVFFAAGDNNRAKTELR